MSVNIQTGNVVKIQSGNRVLISAPGPQGPAGAGGGVTDGDKGDITVTSSGATWTIDNQAVILAKIQHISTASLLGRHASGTGDVQQIGLAGGLQFQGSNLTIDGASITGITAHQVGALAGSDSNVTLTFSNVGFSILDSGFGQSLLFNIDEDLTDDRTLKLKVNDADRAIDLSGDLTVTAAAIISNTNTGDLTLAGTPNYLTLTNQVLTRSLINLGSHVTSTLPVANGGTGATTLTANAVLLGNGTSALQVVAPSTSGNVLTSNGTTWTSAAPIIRGYKRAIYTSTASGTTTCSVITSTTLRAMTEGDQYMTITYTPTDAASRLVVQVRFMAGSSSTAWGGLLLARSGDANARVQCTGDGGAVINSTASVSSHTLVLDEVAGGTSAITYNVRFGGNAAGTFYMNRASGGVYPAGTQSYIEITEYAP